jgi:hypothetical protein
MFPNLLDDPEIQREGEAKLMGALVALKSATKPQEKK